MRKIDHVLEKKALLDYKYIDAGIFSKGLTHEFCQKMKMFSFFVFGQKLAFK